MHWAGGVSAQGGCLPKGGMSAQGEYLPGGGYGYPGGIYHTSEPQKWPFLENPTSEPQKRAVCNWNAFLLYLKITFYLLPVWHGIP